MTQTHAYCCPAPYNGLYGPSWSSFPFPFPFVFFSVSLVMLSFAIFTFQVFYISIYTLFSTRISLLVCLGHHSNDDKSLARPGTKEATATKLGIYSTYSPRGSIHFLARCSNFCNPLKKKSEICPSNQVSAAAMTSASDEKWPSYNFFFSPGNRWYSDGARSGE